MINFSIFIEILLDVWAPLRGAIQANEAKETNKIILFYLYI